MVLSRFLSFINFFLLGFLVLVLYYYVHRLRHELKIVKTLRNLSKQYKDLIDESSEGVFHVDADGKFNIINDAGANILGYKSAQDLSGKKLDVKEVFPDYDIYFEDFKERLFRRGNLQDQVEIVIGHDLAIIEINVKLKKDQYGKFLGIEGIFRNVTQRVEMQNQLKQYSEQLENMVKVKTSINLQLEREKFDLEKLAAIGQASSTIVHEIRNPLSSIKMGLSTLLSRVALDEQDENLILIANKEIFHLEKMLREILDYSKPNELNLTTQNVNHILLHLCNQFRDLFDDSNIQCETELSPKIENVLLDFDKINQVFTNIILNAVQAMDESGRLIIQTSLNKDHLEIVFIDFGKGIPEKKLAKVFNPFYSTKAKGTGLGLPLVQKIVHSHNGKVFIESKIDQGTKVKVLLPVHQEKK